MKTYKGVEIRTISELRDPRVTLPVKNRAIKANDDLWERLGAEARMAGTSIGELIRAVMLAWLDKDYSSTPTDGAMDEDAYLTDLACSKYFQRCDDKGAGYRAGIDAYRSGVPYEG